MNPKYLAPIFGVSLFVAAEANAASVTFDLTNPGSVGQLQDVNGAFFGTPTDQITQFRRGFRLDVTGGTADVTGAGSPGVAIGARASKDEDLQNLQFGSDLVQVDGTNPFGPTAQDGKIDGIGINTSDDPFSSGSDPFDNFQVDGTNGNDFLRLTVSNRNGAPVEARITQIIFGVDNPEERFVFGTGFVLESNDNFDFAIDGVDQDAEAIPNGDLLGNHPNGNVAQNPVLGQLFNDEIEGVRVVNLPNTLPRGSFFDFYAADSNDDWVIAGITVDITPAVVPLPAPAMLLATGLLGLGIVGRRRRRDRA
ncbi:MAG: hypothetical protein AAFR17_02365 [Pseudomonadota bacterium]